jgi:hypothetical protein
MKKRAAPTLRFPERAAAATGLVADDNCAISTSCNSRLSQLETSMFYADSVVTTASFGQSRSDTTRGHKRIRALTPEVAN